MKGVQCSLVRHSALLAGLALMGCTSNTLLVVPLPPTTDAEHGAADRPLYSIRNGIHVSNTASATPKAWSRATAFCREQGKEPREEQITQQWPAVRDLIFSCVPVPDRHLKQ